ncbi:MAG TPA: ISKra4 family transposase [Ramlibacter sp.]
MIMAQEQAILKAREVFNTMVAVVGGAAGQPKPLHEAERRLWDLGLAMMRQMLEGYVAGFGQGDLGPTLEHKGRSWRRLDQPHTRRYVSVFGPLQIDRRVYGTRETQKHEMVPLDAMLSLPEGDFSYLLQQWDQGFCVQNSYSQSRQSVQQILGIGQSVRSLEHMSRAMAADADPFLEAQALPPAEQEGEVLVVTADGKGVPMCRVDGEGAPHGRLSKGQKKQKKREACVGAVYSVDRFERTAEDVMDEMSRQQKQAQRPRPQHKRLRAELTRPDEQGREVRGKQRTFAWLAEQVAARNPGGEKPVVCLMDGAAALWAMAAAYLNGVTCVLDLLHVMEYIWKAAHCFHPEASVQAHRFASERLKRILEGDVGRVVGGLRQMRTRAGKRLSKAKRQTLETVIGYLDRNRDYMRYDAYLAAGYPIASGVVEGACRHLVADRMELSGMRWWIPGAQAMLHLRAIHLNGDWDDFQRYRIEQATNRLYPDRNRVIDRWKRAA